MAARACDAMLTGRFLCVLTQKLQRLNLIHVAVLQGGHVVDGVPDDKFQIRQFILKWEEKTETNQMLAILIPQTCSPVQLSVGS